jgi:hypothetical protein
MINIIEMIDDLNEVEQDVLEEIDPDGPNGTGPNGYSGGPKWDGPNRNGTC